MTNDRLLLSTCRRIIAFARNDRGWLPFYSLRFRTPCSTLGSIGRRTDSWSGKLTRRLRRDRRSKRKPCPEVRFKISKCLKRIKRISKTHVVRTSFAIPDVRSAQEEYNRYFQTIIETNLTGVSIFENEKLK